MKKIQFLLLLLVFLLGMGIVIIAETDEAAQTIEEKSITVKALAPNVLIKKGNSVTITGKGFQSGSVISSLGIIPADTVYTDKSKLFENMRIIYSSHDTKTKPTVVNGQFTISTIVKDPYEDSYIAPGQWKIFLWWIPAGTGSNTQPTECMAASREIFTISESNASEPPPTPHTPAPKASASSQILVKVDGKTVDFDVPPQIIKGSTLVPLRAIFDALGAKITWDDKTKTVTGKKGSIAVKLTIDNPVAIVNGVEKKLEVPGTIIKRRTLVPARFISESLGAKIDWDDATKTIIIVTR